MPKYERSDTMSTEEILSPGRKIYSVKELREKGLSQYKVNKLVKEGKLTKLNKSHYENMGYQGEESDLYYAEAFAPKGVVCLLSAAAYYNLTTYIPDAVDVAIARKDNISTAPEWPPMNIHHYTDDRYKLGISSVKEGENGFMIYDLEKTVADVVYYREKVGIEETKEVLTTYLRRNDRNLERLLTYAKALKCSNVLKQYLEVLL